MANEEKVRLGGMALANGVLVHGPTSWACAVRTADGEIKVESRLKRTFASGVSDAAGIIPRFGESVMDVPVTVSVLDIVSRAMRMAQEPPPGKITYRLEGTLHGPAFGSVRFESHGDLALPDPWMPFTGAER